MNIANLSETNKFYLKLLVGTVILLVLILGFNTWRQNTKQKQTEFASQIYFKLLDSIREENNKSIESLASLLVKEYNDTAYGIWGSWFLAKQAIDNNNWQLAEQLLTDASNNSRYKQLELANNLRLIKVLIELKKYEAGIDLINKVLANKKISKSYAALYSEILGDIYLLSNDKDKAFNSYKNAEKSMHESKNFQLGQDELLNLKINSLGVS